jgi:hypothetical protein
MRTFFAWFFGVAVFLVVGVGVGIVGDLVGVPAYIYHATPVGYWVDGEYAETDSTTTAFGMGIMLLAIVLGVWSGRATFFASVRAGFSEKGNFTFFAWLMAAVVLCVAGALVDLAFRSVRSSLAGYLLWFVEVTIAVGVGWSCHQWWKNRVAHIGE